MAIFTRIAHCVVAMLILLNIGLKASTGIQLVKGGKTTYQLYLPLNPSAEEIRAAQFLNEHLQKIASCPLPVIKTNNIAGDFCVVISKSAKISEPDGFKITAKNNLLKIEGGSNKGCIYGISEILERFLGVRYFSPSFVRIPLSENIYIPETTITGSSPNTYRNVHGQFSKNENYKDFHRLNSIEDIFADQYYVHTFNKLIPWTENFKTHPEYYALLNGKRCIDQLCLTNSEVLSLVIKKLQQEMLLQPAKKIWSVSQNDNYSYCHCENCSLITREEKSPAGPVIRFVNQVAAAFPDKIISTLAYQYSRTAPAITRPAENVQVMLCTIELNRSKPIASDPLSVLFLNDLKAWGEICNHIYLWDYTVDFAHSYSPFPNIHTFQPNIKLFVNNHVKEHFQQSNTDTGHEFSELKSYLLAKLLWNPDTDVPAIIEEFTNGYYGAAAPWIRKYLYHLQDEIIKTGEWLDIYGPPTNYQNTFLSDQNISSYERYFDEAEKAVSDDREMLLHVRIARMSLKYAMMEIGKNDMFGPRGWYKGKDGDFELNQTMLKTLESFHQTSQEGKCSPINESGLTTDEYYHSTKRFINVQVKGNFAFRKKVTASPMPAEKYSSGNLAFLTNGVRGANDFKVHWLGWESQDFNLILDLGSTVSVSNVEISTLWDPKSWILHPRQISCLVSDNGIDFSLLETQTISDDQQKGEVNHTFGFSASGKAFRYVKFDVKGTLNLFDWHPSAGGGSWVFVDEIVVK